MKTKFLYEHHNRQDKTHKPDYKDEMRIRGRSSPQRLGLKKSPGLMSESIRRAKEYELKQAKRRFFCLHGRVFRLGWSLGHFAKANNFSADQAEAKHAYQTIRTAALSDMRAITAAIMEGEVRRTDGKRSGKYKLSNLRVRWRVETMQCQLLSSPKGRPTSVHTGSAASSRPGI